MPYPSEHPHVNKAYAINRKTDAKFQKRGIYQPVISYRYQNKIWYFMRYYETKSVQFKDVDHAKMFICLLIDEFLEPLNSDEKLRPFFKEYPLTWKNFDVAFSFYDSNGYTLRMPYISCIRKYGDTFVCMGNNENDKESIKIHEEPMSAVYKWYLVQKQQNTSKDTVS